jgi:hypothetical protein
MATRKRVLAASHIADGEAGVGVRRADALAIEVNNQAVIRRSADRHPPGH